MSTAIGAQKIDLSSIMTNPARTVPVERKVREMCSTSGYDTYAVFLWTYVFIWLILSARLNYDAARQGFVKTGPVVRMQIPEVEFAPVGIAGVGHHPLERGGSSLCCSAEFEDGMIDSGVAFVVVIQVRTRTTRRANVPMI